MTYSKTAGSIVLYTTKHGGILLTGDSATGNNANQAKPQLRTFHNPLFCYRLLVTADSIFNYRYFYRFTKLRNH